MAKCGIRIKLDVKKLQKELFFLANSGAVYADLTTFVDLVDKDQYGNSGFITQDVSKDARESGTKGPIVGNVSVFWSDAGPPEAKQARQQPAAVVDDGMGIPF